MQKKAFASPALVSLFEERIVKSKAVGLDGTRLESFAIMLHAETDIIARKVAASTYRFKNYREKLISKGAGKYPRQISIPTVRDRLTMRAICNTLSEIAPSSKNRPPHSIIKSIVDYIRGPVGHSSFIRVDVKDFFPTIDHEILLSELVRIGCEPFLVDLVRSAVKNCTGFKSLGAENKIGVPQGLSISNILSSIYLNKFDEKYSKNYAYFRYVDDILIVAPSFNSTDIFKEIYADLSKLGLVPHMLGLSGKSEIKLVPEGIDYLGYHVTSTKVSVRESSYRRMFVNLNKVFTLFEYKRKVEPFLFKLNLRITGCIVDGKRKGWLMFFSQTENLSQLSYLDLFVQKQLARLGVPNLNEKVARFIKSYHEIRYKGDDSVYIPNFDSYGLEQKYLFISALTGSSVEELESRSIEATEYEFKTLVAKEVSDLEQDVLDSVS